MSDRLWANRLVGVRADRSAATVNRRVTVTGRVPVARRVAVAAVLTVAGGLALSGCRSAPDVAAYVGDDVITVAQVEDIFTDLNSKTKPAATPTAEPAPGQPIAQNRPVTRTDVLNQLVLGKACAIAQAKEGFKGQTITAEQVAQQQGIPADSLFAAERAKTETCLSGVQLGTSEAPTEADLRDIYDRAKANLTVTVSFEEIKPQLGADPDIRSAVGAKRAITKLVTDANVVVNPRYRPLEYGLSDLGNEAQIPLIVAVLGNSSSDVVRDLS